MADLEAGYQASLGDSLEQGFQSAQGENLEKGYQKALPYRILDTVKEMGEGALEVLNTPGDIAVWGAKKMGVDTEKPSYGLSVPLRPSVELPPAGTMEGTLRDVAMTVAPAAGLGAAVRYGSRAAEPLAPLAQTSYVGLKNYKSDIGPPPPSGALIESQPGLGPGSSLKVEHELLTEPKGPGVRTTEEFMPIEPAGALSDARIAQKVVDPIRIEQLRQRALKPSLDTLDDGLPSSVKAKLPPGWSRMVTDAISVLARTHPSGERAGSLWMDVRDQVEQQALTGTQNFERSMDTIWGRRSPVHPKQFNPVSHYETASTWKISKDEVDQVVDYLYSAGRIKPTGPHASQIVETAEAYAKSTMEASGHPGVREYTYFDPVTMSDRPLGEPGMFFSHLPMGKKAEGMQMRAYNEGWKQFHQKFPNKTRADFDDFMKKGQSDVRGYAGIERARIFDAEEGGRPSVNLRKNGYDTDPRRVLFNYLRGTYGAGERKLAEPIWKSLEDDILNNTTDVKTNAWVRTMFDRMRETDFEISDKIIGDTISHVNNITNTGLLQYSTPMQANQAMYIVQRAGLANFGRALLSKGSADLSNKSAAVFADYLTTLSIGAHDPFSRALQTELTLNGFTGMDRLLRGLAGRTGDIQIQQLYKRLLESPGDKGLRAQVKEFGLDADNLLSNGLQETDRLKAAKRFADETQGRRDLRGLPLWAADNTPIKRLMLNLKNFMLINTSVLKRDIIDAHSRGIPLKTVLNRAGQGVVAAGVLGEVTKDILYTLTALETPFQDKRTPKALRDLFGAGFGRVADDVITGYSTIALSLLVTMAQQDRTSVLEAVVPPVVGLAARAIEDPLKVATRLFPGGPTLAKQFFPPKQKGGLQMDKMEGIGQP